MREIRRQGSKRAVRQISHWEDMRANTHTHRQEKRESSWKINRNVGGTISQICEKANNLGGRQARGCRTFQGVEWPSSRIYRQKDGRMGKCTLTYAKTKDHSITLNIKSLAS